MANICFIKSKSVCCGSTCLYQALIWSFISDEKDDLVTSEAEDTKQKLKVQNLILKPQNLVDAESSFAINQERQF